MKRLVYIVDYYTRFIKIIFADKHIKNYNHTRIEKNDFHSQNRRSHVIYPSEKKAREGKKGKKNSHKNISISKRRAIWSIKCVVDTQKVFPNNYVHFQHNM